MTTNRREFIRALAAVAGTVAGGCACPFRGCGGPRLAAQLYSIHKIFWAEPEWCLSELKSAGYEGVEFAGYGGHTAKEIRKYLSDSGMLGIPRCLWTEANLSTSNSMHFLKQFLALHMDDDADFLSDPVQVLAYFRKLFIMC